MAEKSKVKTTTEGNPEALKKAETTKTTSTNPASKAAEKKSTTKSSEKVETTSTKPAPKAAEKKSTTKQIEKEETTSAKPASNAAEKKSKPKEIKAQVDFLPEGEEEIITLYDDDNKPVDFYQEACIEYDGELYVLMQPKDKLDGIAEDEAVIFRLEEEDEENDLFIPVSDEELLDKIFEEYLKALADEEDDYDDEE